ncbi:hypothetical protein ACFQX4_20040, partial [Roseomonas sp. GCM10028921]
MSAPCRIPPLAALLAAWLPLGCVPGAQPAPPPLPAACRAGPEGERGIGGTGVLAEASDGDRGIGGTGILGVVTGFGSICVRNYLVDAGANNMQSTVTMPAPDRMTLEEFHHRFPDEETARAWFERARW